MPDGGEFIIHCENVRLVEASGGLQPGEYVVVACSDNGRGIPAAVVQRAFEPPFTAKAASAGTGLGLAQVATRFPKGLSCGRARRTGAGSARSSCASALPDQPVDTRQISRGVQAESRQGRS